MDVNSSVDVNLAMPKRFALAVHRIMIREVAEVYYENVHKTLHRELSHLDIDYSTERLPRYTYGSHEACR